MVALLFLFQVLLGALMAHYYVQGESFYGLDILGLLPFNIARGWHLQLAIFWIATAWLALGIFVAPLVGGREPRRQGLLVDLLFVALVVVVAGSLLGEWLGARGYLGNLWFLLGNQGWEYLELGRVWQLLLAAGLAVWLFIVYRGLRPAMKSESDRGGLVHLRFYSAVAIPFFYGFAFLFDPSTHLTMSDYWRWWVIHLWVEGMFEVFAVVVIGFLMVKLGLLVGPEPGVLPPAAGEHAAVAADPAGQRLHRDRGDAAGLVRRDRLLPPAVGGGGGSRSRCRG